MTHKDSTIAPARLCVMISGSGRTLVNLHQAAARKQLNATIELVIASKPCLGVERARDLKLTTQIIPGDISTEILGNLYEEHRIDLVVLGGYTKLVQVPEGFEGRVVNIHPALLPRHGGKGMYGLRVHEAVLSAGDAQSGCTVHLCDQEYDRGQVLMQKECAVLGGDTPQTLADRVFELECQVYPRAIENLIASLASKAVDQPQHLPDS